MKNKVSALLCVISFLFLFGCQNKTSNDVSVSHPTLQLYCNWQSDDEYSFTLSSTVATDLKIEFSLLDDGNITLYSKEINISKDDFEGRTAKNYMFCVKKSDIFWDINNITSANIKAYDARGDLFADNTIKIISSNISNVDETSSENITNEQTTDVDKYDALLDIQPTLKQSYKGNGDYVITDVFVETGSIMKFSCSDNRHKSVKAHHSDTYELLVNSSQNYSGTTFLEDCYDTTVDFEITANSDWVLEIYKLGSSSTDSFNGNGDFVTPMFSASSKVYEIIYNGNRHISIKGYYGNYNYDLLMNEIGEYSGRVYFTPDDNICFFVIETEGEWSIRPIK